MSKITHATLLKLFLNFETYQKYSKYVNTDWFNEQSREVYYGIREYYSKHSGDIVLDDFVDFFNVIYRPDISETQRNEYRGIFEKLAREVPQEFGDLFDALQRRALKEKLQESLEGEDIDVEQIKRSLEGVKSFSQKQIEEVQGEVENDIERLVQTTKRDHGLRWSLDCLNKGIGPLIKGDFVIVAAYVDTGKTAFAITAATHMAQQITEGTVLWLNNEEYDDRVLKKLWMCTLGCPWSKILKAPNKAKEAYTKRMNGDLNRIRFYNIRHKGLRDIQKICEAHDTRLIVIDQIDKLSGGHSKDGAEHLRLKNLYGDVRVLANTIAPVIVLSQADSSTRSKSNETGEIVYHRVVDQSQLDGSKVGKPGEADAVIGIGKDLRFPNSRYITISKNKLDSEDEFFRNLRGYEVLFNGGIAKYENPQGSIEI